MAEDWPAVAGEVAAAIAEVGRPVTLRSGIVPRVGSLLPAGSKPQADVELLAVTTGDAEGPVEAGGATVARRTILAAARGARPDKGDRIGFFPLSAAASTSMPWWTIEGVEAVSPAGVDLVYQLELIL